MTAAFTSAVAVDAGSRFTRIAVLGADGSPVLARLSGSVPGEGVPVPRETGARGAALRAAYGEYCGSHGIPDRVVLVVREQDRAGAADRAADALSAVHGTRPAPRIRVLGTPHAVLALLRHAGAPPSERYAVCELGASAAEVSVCAPVSGTVAVTGRAWHAPADGYGAGLDRALLAAVGMPDDAAGLRALAGARGRRAPRSGSASPCAARTAIAARTTTRPSTGWTGGRSPRAWCSRPSDGSRKDSTGCSTRPWAVRRPRRWSRWGRGPVRPAGRAPRRPARAARGAAR